MFPEYKQANYLAVYIHHHHISGRDSPILKSQLHLNGQPLLDAEEVYCEVPFGYKEELPNETVIWNGIMDVIYCSGGKWHIVDYKTNADGSDLDNEYQNQLNAYIKAFKEITGNEADAKTYHIDV